MTEPYQRAHKLLAMMEQEKITIFYGEEKWHWSFSKLETCCSAWPKLYWGTGKDLCDAIEEGVNAKRNYRITFQAHSMTCSTHGKNVEGKEI